VIWSLLNKAHINKATKVLSNLWNGIDIDARHFKSRLVALNKVSPDTPRKDQFRPIVISSLISKVLEARLVNPLKKYMVNQLHVSQTGFVPGMDTYVNISRLMDQLSSRRNTGKRTFLLFLDFSSALNTVSHSKLFDILGEKQVLSSPEIQLLQAIYSRTIIGLGNEHFRPNIGVPQGSIISPYLFNIYAEDLLRDLQREGWEINELFGYADDHLILNGSINQLRRAINIVKKWSSNYNIKLNSRKSGILEVPPKYKSPVFIVGSSFEGVPVVDRYKYLGVWLDQFLSPLAHLDYLFGSQKNQEGASRGRINNITRFLSPCIKNVSFDYRANLWITFIRPLFLPLAAMSAILTESHQERIQARLRGSLRKFIGLPKNFSIEILAQVFPLDFKEWMRTEYQNCRTKWASRMKREQVPDGLILKYKVQYMRSMPVEFSQYLKCFTAWCEQCDKPFYPKHLEEHGLQRVDIKDLYEDLEKNLNEHELSVTMSSSSLKKGKKHKLCRKERMSIITAHIQRKLTEIESLLRIFAKKNF